MSELLSALKIAINDDWSAQLLAGDLALEGFLGDQGFSFDAIQNELNDLVRYQLPPELRSTDLSNIATILTNTSTCTALVGFLEKSAKITNLESVGAGAALGSRSLQKGPVVGHKPPVTKQMRTDGEWLEKELSKALNRIESGIESNKNKIDHHYITNKLSPDALKAEQWYEQAVAPRTAIKTYAADNKLLVDWLKYNYRHYKHPYADGWKAASDKVINRQMIDKVDNYASTFRSNHLNFSARSRNYRIRTYFDKKWLLRAESNAVQWGANALQTAQEVNSLISNHEHIANLYKVARQDTLGRADLGAFKGDIIKHIVTKQANNALSNFSAFYKQQSSSNSKYARAMVLTDVTWTGTEDEPEPYTTHMWYATASSKHYTTSYTAYHITGGSGDTIYNSGYTTPLVMSNRYDGWVVGRCVKQGKWTYSITVATSGNRIYFNEQTSKKAKRKENYTTSISMLKLFEMTNAYKRDCAIVQKHRDGTLVPEVVKQNFGQILAVTQTVYGLKRDIAIEKKYWPNVYTDCKKTNWNSTISKVNGDVAQGFDTILTTNTRAFSQNRKSMAQELQLDYGIQLVVNTSERFALTNAYYVYKRDILDGMSVKQAERLANLTYFSDIILYDEFISLSTVPRLSRRGYKDIGTNLALGLGCASLPFVIYRQYQYTKRLLKLERVYRYMPKLALLEARADIFKDRVLTKALAKEDSNYSKYLGFHPIRRSCRATSLAIRRGTADFETDVINKDFPKIAAGLDKTINVLVGATLFIAKALKNLPKHLYDDTRTLCRQLGKVFSGNATWLGVWDTLGRDTKGTRDVLFFVGMTLIGGNVWDPRVQRMDATLTSFFTTGWQYEKHKAKIKKAEAVFVLEYHLHKSLHKDLTSTSYSNLIKSPFQNLSDHWKFVHNDEVRIVEAPFRLLRKDIDDFRKISKAIDKTKTVGVLITNLLDRGELSQILSDSRPFLGSVSSYIKKHGPGLNEIYIRCIQSSFLKRLYTQLINHLSALKSVYTQGLTVNDVFRVYVWQLEKKKANFNLNDFMNKYLRKHFVPLKSVMVGISEVQATRFHRQRTVYSFVKTHPNQVQHALEVGAFALHVHQFIEEVDSSIKKQVAVDWSSGGKRLFRRVFDYSLGYALPLAKDRNTFAKNEIASLQQWQYNKKPGEHLFGAILVGDLVHRLIVDTPLLADAGQVEQSLSACAYGVDALRIISWETRKTVDDVRFVLKVGSTNISAKSIAHARVNVVPSLARLTGKRLNQLVLTYPNVIPNDLVWYQQCKTKGLLLKHWRIRVSADAQKGDSVAIAWQKDVKTIKDGGTLSVGEILNSLEPTNDDWALRLVPPSQIAPPDRHPPSLSKAQADKEAVQDSDESLKVSLLGLWGRMRFAKHIYNKFTTKKNEPGSTTKKKEPGGDDVPNDENIAHGEVIPEEPVVDGKVVREEDTLETDAENEAAEVETDAVHDAAEDLTEAEAEETGVEIDIAL